MKHRCSRIHSEFTRPMFSIEDSSSSSLEASDPQLDLKATFQIGKGFCSYAGVSKLVSLLITVAILVHATTTHPAPLWFYPAYLTSWGVFFSISYLFGSLLLTTCYNENAKDNTTSKNNNRLVNFTWLIYSLAFETECIATLLYWALRPDSMGPIEIVNVTTHGVILPILLVQGLVVDRVPSRLKHSCVTVLFGVVYVAWLALQNVVLQYNPLDEYDGDDDSIYVGLRWKNETIRTLVYSSIICFVIVPFFAIIIWALSLPGRRYMVEKSNSKPEHEKSITVRVLDDESCDEERKISEEQQHDDSVIEEC